MFGVRQLHADLAHTCSKASLPEFPGLSELSIPPLVSGDNQNLSECLRVLSAHRRLTVSAESLPLWGGLRSTYNFKEEAALFPIPQAQTRTVLINKANRRRELICSPSHTKLSARQVMGLHINAFEVRRATYNRNCLACEDLFPV